MSNQYNEILAEEIQDVKSQLNLLNFDIGTVQRGIATHQQRLKQIELEKRLDYLKQQQNYEA